MCIRDSTEGEQPEAVEEVSNPRARVIDLLLPIIVLVVLCVSGLVYSGYLNGADVYKRQVLEHSPRGISSR